MTYVGPSRSASSSLNSYRAHLRYPRDANSVIMISEVHADRQPNPKTLPYESREMVEGPSRICALMSLGGAVARHLNQRGVHQVDDWNPSSDRGHDNPASSTPARLRPHRHRLRAQPLRRRPARCMDPLRGPQRNPSCFQVPATEPMMGEPFT